MASTHRHGGTSDPGDAFDAQGHPSVETLSEYAEDLLYPEPAAEVRAHLHDCTACADTRDALREIRALLGRDPAPRLPSDVAGRIDAALAAESLLAAELPGLDLDELSATAPDLVTLLRETSAAADEDVVARLVAAEERAAAEGDLPPDAAWSAALLSATGTAPVRSAEAPASDEPDSGRSATEEPAAARGDVPADRASRLRTPETSTPTRPPAGPPAGARPGSGPAASGRGPGRRGLRGRAGRLLLGAAAVAVAAVVSVLAVNTGQGGTTASSGGAVSASAHASGTVFTAADFAAQVHRLVSSGAASNGTMKPKALPGAGPESVAPSGAGSAPACVVSATGRAGTPLAVSSGSYQGRPVYAVVYPASSAPATELDGYLVDASCHDGVLLHQTMPRS
jgi:hypothetical protein